jgi:divinyl protochlorophyllide a 8-vinyl-reductase
MPPQRSDHVGPNAILQTVEALITLSGSDVCDRVCHRAGLPGIVANPPDSMIPARDALSLHRAVAADLPKPEADEIARDAGRRTGDYILAHRIPAPARTILRLLPAGLAGPLLLKAISRHAWTFAGDARVTHETSAPMHLVIHDNPLAIPGCLWHLAVFETLFHRLVSRDVRVTHPACCATDGQTCRFRFDIESKSAGL